jgi:hypothetical protein
MINGFGLQMWQGAKWQSGRARNLEYGYEVWGDFGGSGVAANESGAEWGGGECISDYVGDDDAGADYGAGGEGAGG